MDFRVPKPLHGWREFLGEVGIIVIGILIALGGEQVVEHLRQKSELREAENAMVLELRDDDMPQAYVRASIFNCYADKLDAIESAVASGDRARVVALTRDYRPIYRTWDDQAWKAAVASQVLVGAGTQRMLGWSTAYIAIPLLTSAANAEQEQLPELSARFSGTGPLSALQQDRLYQILARLRRYNRGMTGGSLVLLLFGSRQGVMLSPAKKAELLADARRSFGSCVVVPSPERLDMSSQTRQNNDKLMGRKQ